MSHSVEIVKSDTTQITPNFKANEFFSKDKTFMGNSHMFDSRLFLASQIVRNFVAGPTTVTSTYRTPAGNLLATGNPLSKSQHLNAMAVDLSPSGWLGFIEIYKSDIDNREGVFLDLWEAGVRGFGIYNWGVHLDVRDTGGKQSHGHETFALWDASTVTDPHPFAADTMTDAMTNGEEIAFNPLAVSMIFLILYLISKF